MYSLPRSVLKTQSVLFFEQSTSYKTKRQNDSDIDISFTHAHFNKTRFFMCQKEFYLSLEPDIANINIE